MLHRIVKSARRAPVLLLSVICLLALAACGRPTACCPEWGVSYGLIFGVVRYPDGRPVSGAHVRFTLSGSETLTSAAGAYRLRLAVPALGAGMHDGDINVFPANYQVGVDSVTNVKFTVQTFDSDPITDSTKVDVTLH